jgi:ribosomal protein L1
MSKMGKKMVTAWDGLGLESDSIMGALDKIISRVFVSFDSSCDFSLGLNVDSRKSDQAVRGVSYVPNGLGKKIKIAAFVSADLIEEAQSAGADFVGLDDLVERVKKELKEEGYSVLFVAREYYGNVYLELLYVKVNQGSKAKAEKLVVTEQESKPKS